MKLDIKITDGIEDPLFNGLYIPLQDDVPLEDKERLQQQITKAIESIQAEYLPIMEASKFPNELEQKLLGGFESLLKENNVKFTKQYSPHPREFNRGIKYFVNHNFTKITFHIYNVSDLHD